MVEIETGTIVLPDGSVIAYRSIQPADAAALQRFHLRLSGQSIYLRFFGVYPSLGDGQASYFANVDGFDRFALVALDPAAPRELIAVTRFDREPGTDHAEYAAVVADAWQGHGVGSAMTRLLIEAARRRGIRVFTALVLPENRRMLNLLRDLGLPERIRHEDGVERIEVDLAPEPSDP